MCYLLLKFIKMKFEGDIINLHDVWESTLNEVTVHFTATLYHKDMKKIHDRAYEKFPEEKDNDKRLAYSMKKIANEILKR